MPAPPPSNHWQRWPQDPTLIPNLGTSIFPLSQGISQGVGVPSFQFNCSPSFRAPRRGFSGRGAQRPLGAEPAEQTVAIGPMQLMEQEVCAQPVSHLRRGRLLQIHHV